MNLTRKGDELIVPEGKKGVLLQAVDFSCGWRGMELHFTGANESNVAYVKLDDPDNGKILALAICTRYKGEDVSYFDLAEAQGVHDVYIITEKGVKITEVTFLEESPFAVSTYEEVPEEALEDVGAEFWVATDELGRPVRAAEDVRGVGEKKREVGIFYWSWRDDQSSGEPVNVAKVLKEFPGAEYNIKHPAWAGPHQCSWSEPLYGYYLNRDPYVLRHHAAMLANAGVDMIIFDCTNGSLVWRSSYEPIFEEFRKARLDGIKTPKIAFMLNLFKLEGSLNNTERMIRGLYQDLYKPGRYRDLWYMLDGKPFIMAYEDAVPTEGCSAEDTALLQEIHQFFTFRAGQPSYGYGPTRPDFWGWLEKAPQHKFGEREDGTCEMMTVGVAQNCNDDDLCTYFNNKKTYGRSYTHEFGHTLLSEDSYKYGYNFQEQWDRAIDCDPDFVFITGFNEWIMGQWHDPWVKDADNPQIAFVDQFDYEHSRDIEPDRDSIRDNYYLQLVSNIRRYKGAPRRPRPSAPKTVASLDDWADVAPTYRNNRGMTVHRDCKGFGSTYYTNTTGRNDIISAKVARDKENLYFLAETSAPLTAAEGANWMTLYLDIDRTKDTGWEGYDLAVNRCAPGAIEVWTPMGWKVIGEAKLEIGEKAVMITLPRELADPNGKRLNFEFKWADNIASDDIIDFYVDGDTAPLGRFNYLFKE